MIAAIEVVCARDALQPLSAALTMVPASPCSLTHWVVPLLAQSASKAVEKGAAPPGPVTCGARRRIL